MRDVRRRARRLRRQRRRPDRARGPLLGPPRRRPRDPLRRRPPRSRRGHLRPVLRLCERSRAAVPVCRWSTRTSSSRAAPTDSPAELADAGAAGAIVPDLPPGEAGAVAAALDRARPGADRRSSRRRRRPSASSGSSPAPTASSTWSRDTGVTGERDELPAASPSWSRGPARRRCPGRGRVRDRHARAGGRGRSASPTASSSAPGWCAPSRRPGAPTPRERLSEFLTETREALAAQP